KGGDDVVGVTEPSPTWYFAEGYTGDGFDEFLTVQNPGAIDTAFTVTFMDATGQVTTATRNVAAHGRATVDASAVAGRGKEVSARIDAPVPIVAERPMYFTYGDGIRDG